MFEVTSVKTLAAAAGMAVILGVSSASAATQTCISSIENLVMENVGCQVSPGATQDFLNPLTVNTVGFFGKTDWEYIGKLNIGSAGAENPEGDNPPSLVGDDSDNKSGTFSILASLWGDYGQIMAIFKSGNNPLVGYDLKPGGTVFTYDKQYQQAISHITLYGNGTGTPPDTGATPIPLPAAGWLLLTALGGLGAARLRHRRKDV